MAEEKQKYDPTNVQQYAGKVFLTRSGSKYGVSSDCRFTGRPSIEGAKIDRIAGIKDEVYWDVNEYLLHNDREELNRLIDKEGQKAEKGKDLRLILSLTKKDAVQKGRIGFLSSPIDDIFPLIKME